VTAAATDAQRAEARAVEMGRERHERESALRPARAGSLGPAAPTKSHSHARKRASHADDGTDVVAAVPGARE
jgi:hypothetical protein